MPRASVDARLDDAGRAGELRGPPVDAVRDLLDAWNGAGREEREEGGVVERRAKREAERRCPRRSVAVGADRRSSVGGTPNAARIASLKRRTLE